MTLDSHWVDPTALSHPRPAPTGWARDAVAVAAAMFDAPDDEATAIRLAWVSDELRTLMADVDAMTRLVFRVSLVLLSRIGPWLVLRPWSFRRCDRAQQLRILERYERSPLGLTLLAVKAMLCIIWFEHPQAAADARFDAGCIGEATDA